jgi:hypothetical protein
VFFLSYSEQILDGPRIDRFAEMIALYFITIVVAQERNLFVCFDSLGNDSQIELLS